MSSNHLIDTIKSVITPIHPAGWPFIAGFLLITAILGSFSTNLFWVGLILSGWCVYFFRNPKRTVPTRKGLIVSPADGQVQMITEVTPPEELDLGEEEMTRISVFLNVFDVHVNRVPATGTITKTHYHEGKFLNASLDKASEENERQLIAMETEDNVKIGFVQIAGLIARRIICNAEEEQKVDAGDEYGLIRFGSRVDVYLPKSAHPLVLVGQRCVGGETVLADLTQKKSDKREAVIK